MTTTRHRSFIPRLAAALNAVSLALLCGCGSGLGFPGLGGGSSNPIVPAAATNGPQLGYFWNASDQTMRPVLGIPGSSQIGQSVVPAGTYATGAASSASSVAVLQEHDGSLDVMALPAGAAVHLSASTTAGAQVRFASNGTSAIVFTPGSASIAVLKGLTSTPSVSSVTSPYAIQEGALSNSGSIAVASAGSSGVGIALVSAAGAGTPLGSVGTLGGLAFAGSDNLLFADASANTLTVVSNASTRPSPALVGTGSLLKAPSALGVSANGQWALVANSGEASTVRVDLTGQTVPLRIACVCAPALVATVAGTATFRITAPDSGPLWAVEAGVATPRSFFIPALPSLAANSPVHP